MLRILADRLLPGRVRWLGTLPLTDVPSVLAQVDLLVLPSRHDGWGAVVSEALMLGTPAISSDRCGSAVAVRASGVGGVFPMGNIEVLSQLLETALTRGPVTSSERCVLAEWAKCLGAVQGADYLERILLAHAQNKPLPHAPWVVLPPFHRMLWRLRYELRCTRGAVWLSQLAGRAGQGRRSDRGCLLIRKSRRGRGFVASGAKALAPATRRAAVADDPARDTTG